MKKGSLLKNKNVFNQSLFDIMKQIEPAVNELELYEFSYALTNLYPENGWESVELSEPKIIEQFVNDRDFYSSIQTGLEVKGKIVLDKNIVLLTRKLFAGLVSGKYQKNWVKKHFYFDVRGFLFFHRTNYFSEEIKDHFDGKPLKRFKPEQLRFERYQGIGYKDFRESNLEIDQAFIEIMMELIKLRKNPLLLTLAGPTAAGKTEILSRLREELELNHKEITSIEMDNFLLDREIREEKSMGEDTHHFKFFKRILEEILLGKKVQIPRYDFIKATSSHDINDNLKPDCTPIEVNPADIIFIEGNFPFHIKEISDLIGIKVVYLTDDPIRLKRKWKRDIDYRKKYDTNFFVNRYFKTQFLRACDCYLPQMKVCDIVVDTTEALLWITPDILEELERDNKK
jgi:uridine kinase